MQEVVWIGRFLGGSGFATSTRTYVKALLKFIPNLKIAPLEVLPPSHEFYPYIREVDDTEFKILNHLPVTDPSAQAYFSVWEYDILPKTWIEIFNQAKCVLTQSNFCKKVFQNHLQDPEKVHVIPYILPEEFRIERDEEWINNNRIKFAAENTFVFGSVFEWVPRKVPHLMISAFLNEFNHNEPVCLVLRTILPDDMIIRKQLGSSYHDFKKALEMRQIQIIQTPIPDLIQFYYSLNAYISCTAGEGWGQTLSEAMACGLPTIASKHSGNLDFMNDSNSYLVDVADWSQIDVVLPQDKGIMWRLPLEIDMRNKLRQVFDIWKSGKVSQKALKAQDIRNQLTPNKIGLKLFNVLNKII